MDEDGFEVHYDVVLVGTGLVQSILSAALSKRGRKVLHLDENDFYGGDYHATHTLSQFLDLCQRRKGKGRWEMSSEDVEKVINRTTREDGCDDKELTTEVLATFEQRGHPLNCDSSSLTWLLDLDKSDLGNEGIVLVDSSESCNANIEEAEKVVTQVRSARDGSPVCRGYLMEKLTGDSTHSESSCDPSCCHPCFIGYRSDHQLTTPRLLFESRNFQIDSNPKLLLSAGKMVDAIISSGVGNYLEFKPVESIFYVSAKSPQRKRSDDTDKKVDVTSAASLLQLWQVPCCKKDIFNTKMFTALEKRSLMKLMQLAVDSGRSSDGLPVTTLNENELAQGRALFRPQNKTVGVTSNATVSVCEEEKNFADFLNDSAIPARLQEFVTHALCLDARPAAQVRHSSQGLENLYRHVNASGRYGETSFLIPVYGTSEFAQAFCRLSAVWGGVFLLRESLSMVLTSAAAEVSSCDTSTTPSIALSRVCAVKLTNNKYLACDHLVCDEKLSSRFSTFPQSPSTQQEVMSGGAVRYVQRQMVLTEPFLAPSLSSATTNSSDSTLSTRGVCIFPAQTPSLGNTHAIYLLQLDESTLVAPRGACLAYLMTYIPSRRRPVGSTHFRGMSPALAHEVLDGEEGMEKEDRATAVRLMDKATAMLAALVSTASSTVTPEEKFFATFLHPPRADVVLSGMKSTASAFANVHLCDNVCEKVLYVHEAVCQAEEIFRRMYPDDVFLEDTEENNTAQTRYIPDEEDDEGLGAILSSAEQAAVTLSSTTSDTVTDTEWSGEGTPTTVTTVSSSCIDSPRQDDNTTEDYDVAIDKSTEPDNVTAPSRENDIGSAKEVKGDDVLVDDIVALLNDDTDS